MILNVGLTCMILFFKNYLFIVSHILVQAHECHTVFDMVPSWRAEGGFWECSLYTVGSSAQIQVLGLAQKCFCSLGHLVSPLVLCCEHFNCSYE